MEPFDALVRQMPVPMAVFREADHRVCMVNDAWRQYWDVVADTVGSVRIEDLLTDEQARLHRRLLTGVQQNGGAETWPEIAVMVRRDGRFVLRYLTVVVSLIAAASQQPGWIGMIITDVTETVLARQQADDAAREQEVQRRMMQEALDKSPVSIVITSSLRDPQTGQITDFAYRLANREAHRLSNLPPEDDLLARTLLTAFPGDLDSGIFNQFRRVVDTGEPMAAETHYQHGGVDKWFYIRAARHGDGFIQTTLDITPVKEAEAATERQADLMRTILDNAQTAVSLHSVIRDRDGRIADFRTVLANKLVMEIWGDTADQNLNQTFLEYRPEAAGTAEFNRYAQVVETGEPAQFEYIYRDRVYSINIARAGDGVVLSSIDVTSDRQYRQQLEQINAELKRSNESLQAFAYIASHDLQEPLRKIISFSSILTHQHTGQLDPSGQDMLNRMQLAAGRMSDLIRDLLTYARIGSQPDAFRPVDLSGLVHDLLDDMDMAIQSAGATVDVGPLPHLSGDTVQLRQLFQNLISNALKFRRDGVPPVVQISGERVGAHTLPSSLTELRGTTHDYWVIRVADNGIGFAPEYADRIFQVFQRLHGRSQYSGTGIGLAIVRKVAEQHGGTVVAESQPGIGSAFSVYLAV